MSTAEIIAELPRLSSTELALVQAKLRELVESERAAVYPNPIAAQPTRMRTPQLARPELSKDFIKLILEHAPDAKL